MKRFNIHAVISIPLILLLLFGCEKRREKEKAPPEVVEEEPEAEEAVEQVPALIEGYITYLSGDVSIKKAAQWGPCDIDDFVGIEDRIKTEIESFCEVQFTDIGIIRIQENTEIAMREIYLKEENNVDVSLVDGDLLCKVSKLSKGDSFQVTTDTALAGVRGTEFVIKAEKGKSTKVAVSKGEVTVIPAPVAQKIEEIKKELQTDIAKQTLEEISLPQIIVTEEKEVTMEIEQSQEAAREFEEISPVIEKIIKEIDKKAIEVEEKQKEVELLPEKKAQKQREEIQEIKKDIEALKTDVATTVNKKASVVTEEVLSEPEAASEAIQEDFREIEKIKPKEAEMVIARKEIEGEEKVVYTKITIKVSPKDATIFVNGEPRGKGTIKELHEPGEVLMIRAELEGYVTAEQKVEVLEQRTQDVSIELDRFKRPVSLKLPVSNRKFIRAVVTSGERIFAADGSGRVYCLSEEGKKLWEVATENTPNENSIPVISNNSVCFSGEKELVVIDIETGRVLARVEVGKGALSSHLFGRRAAYYKDNLVYPSNDSLLFLDIRNLKEKKAISVQGSSNCSPSLWKGKIIIVNKNGELLIIDPETEKTESSISTGAIQPVCLAPTLWDDSCAFAGRKGIVAAVDLKKQRVMWEHNIDKGVFQDITVGRDSLYPFTGNVFYVLSLKDGHSLFDPVSSSCSPLYHDGMLYHGDSQRNFIVTNASTGKLLKRYKLDGLITAMPALIDNTIIVATDAGTIYGLNPEDI